MPLTTVQCSRAQGTQQGLLVVAAGGQVAQRGPWL